MSDPYLPTTGSARIVNGNTGMNDLDTVKALFAVREHDLQSKITKLQEENKELIKLTQRFSSTMKILQESHDALRKSLTESEASNAKMRGVLEYVKNYWYLKAVIDGKDYVHFESVIAVIVRASEALSALESVVKEGEE